MSTRAVYTFRGDQKEYHVYKHYDGYPSGAFEFITLALSQSWKLPRFEPDEFAASFVAANKGTDGGNVRLMCSGDWRDVSPLDIEYRYEITHVGNEKDLTISAYEVSSDRYNKLFDNLIFHGSLEEMAEWINKVEGQSDESQSKQDGTKSA